MTGVTQDISDQREAKKIATHIMSPENMVDELGQPWVGEVTAGRQSCASRPGFQVVEIVRGTTATISASSYPANTASLKLARRLRALLTSL